jgi:sulfite exporter TauE/SafE
VDLALVLAAALMGLAGAPHCAAMCGAASAGVVRACSGAQSGRGWAAFLSGRTVAYAAGGALAASAVSLLATLGQTAGALRALWTLLHLAAFGLGLWLLITARQPAWLKEVGRAPVPAVGGAVAAGGWQRMQGPLRAGGTGLLWLAWPCGLLQSALVVAALANTPLTGALAMLAFSLTSSLGLAVVPALSSRWTAARFAAWQSPAWAVRLAGLALAGASGWALGHGLWERVVAPCLA